MASTGPDKSTIWRMTRELLRRELVPGFLGKRALPEATVRGSGTVGHTLQTIASSPQGTEAAWVAPSVNTLVDAKGDLLVGSAADTLARVAVGENNHALFANSSASSGVSWKKPYGLQAGVAALTSDSAGSGDKLSFTIAGDGVTPVEIYASALISSDGAAGTTVYVDIRDGSGGGGTLIAPRDQFVSSGAGRYHRVHPIGVCAAWTGDKTFYLNLGNTAGTPTMYGAGVNKAYMRAVWAPGLTST